MVGIWAPASYLLFLIGSLYTFSHFYRKQSSIKPIYVPWFPQQKARDIYISLLSLPVPPPKQILIAALLRRAMEDVKQIWLIREQKQSLSLLVAKGQVGEELWERFLRAEKELESEIVEVVGEANTFQEGYGGLIFGMASDMVAHEKWKEIYSKIPEARLVEKARNDSASGPASVFGHYSYLSPSDLTLCRSNPLPPAVPRTTEKIVAPSPVTLARESSPLPPVLPTPISIPAPTPTTNGLAPPAQLPIAPPSPVVEQEATPEPEAEDGDADEEGEAENQASGSVSPATGGSRTPSKKNKKKKKPAKK